MLTDANLKRSRFIFGVGAAALAGCGGGQASLPISATSNSLSRLDSVVNNSGLNDIRAKLEAVASSADAATLRRLTATLLTDPAVPALAQYVKQTYGSILTAFQTSMLNAIPIATRDPGLLIAILAGTPLTSAQRQSLGSIRGALHQNAAFQ